jgi:hypothetical protein
MAPLLTKAPTSVANFLICDSVQVSPLLGLVGVCAVFSARTRGRRGGEKTASPALFDFAGFEVMADHKAKQLGGCLWNRVLAIRIAVGGAKADAEERGSLALR